MANAILDLIISFGQLKTHTRTGWLSRGIDKASVESIADHVSRTAFVAMILADRIGIKQKIDVGSVLRMAILHDLAETLLTDIDKQAWKYLGPHSKAEAERRAIEDLLRRIPSSFASIYTKTWRGYKQGESIEAKIVQASDKLELAIQALEYVERGIPQRKVKDMLKDARKQVNAFGISEANLLLKAVFSRLSTLRSY